MAQFDAVIIGANPNGLTAAAFLAKARQSVLLLDEGADQRRATQALPPEFIIEPVAGPGWLSDDLRRELDLDRHGLQMLAPEATLASIDANGDHLVIRRELGKTVEALRARVPRDAERWPAFAERLAKLSGFLRWLYLRPPPRLKSSSIGDWLDLAAVGRRARALGRADLIELTRVLPMPIADLLEDTFDDERLTGCIAATAVAGIQHGPHSGGTTFAWLHHHVGAWPGAIGMRQRVRGGSAALARALAQAAQRHGVEIRPTGAVAGIKTVGGRTTGVTLANGDEIDAARVLSSVGIRRTFLDLVGPGALDPELVRAIQNIRYRGVVARVHLALDALPTFRGLSADALDGVISITPGLDGIERAYDDAKYGRTSAEPLLEVRIPSMVDSGLAPSGKHVMSISMQYAPYRLRDGVWDEARRKALGDDVMSRLSMVAPRLATLVRHREVLTPADLAEGHGLPEGSIEHGELALDQALFMRPVPECSRYRTPVQGLYLCGDDMHPGRGIVGGAGRLAAREVLKG